MNGDGVKGGAFGFRVTSINKVSSISRIPGFLKAQCCPKLVDTKSLNNTTLLHFLERTVAKHFPEMEVFLDELEKPADAHRGTAADLSYLGL
jgi:cytokinesis protein